MAFLVSLRIERAELWANPFPFPLSACDADELPLMGSLLPPGRKTAPLQQHWYRPCRGRLPEQEQEQVSGLMFRPISAMTR